MAHEPAVLVDPPHRRARLDLIGAVATAPALETSGWQGAVGPAGMPRGFVNRIAKAVRATISKPGVTRWVPVIRASGASLE